MTARHGLAGNFGVGKIGIHRRRAMIAPNRQIGHGGHVHVRFFWQAAIWRGFRRERGHGEKTVPFGTPGALFAAMSAFVLHGLPTTSTRTSLAAFFRNGICLVR